MDCFKFRTNGQKLRELKALLNRLLVEAEEEENESWVGDDCSTFAAAALAKRTTVKVVAESMNISFDHISLEE